MSPARFKIASEVEWFLWKPNCHGYKMPFDCKCLTNELYRMHSSTFEMTGNSDMGL